MFWKHFENVLQTSAGRLLDVDRTRLTTTDLDRVPKKELRADGSCPICRMPFLDDEYPLVVRLPCHKDHVFDLECLQPWLKMNNSCPLDRKELEKKRAPPPPKDDDEEEYDDMYA